VLLAEVVALLEADYPPSLAESWDAVGLVCGDPADEVRRVHFAVDPVEEVVAEALGRGADLLVTHHPLYLRGTSSVAATTSKGRVVQALVRGGCALHVAHTNADRADPGVSDALAALFDLRDTVPLQPALAVALDTLAVTVPVADAARLRDALHDAGAGEVGAYDRVSWSSPGSGRFRPGEGARPAIGEPGRLEVVEEERVEVVLQRGRRAQVLAAMRAAHPYEEVAFDLHEQVSAPGRTGLGRVGQLPEPLALRELVDRAAQVLPATAWGVRGAGDPDAAVHRLAVSGGAGDSLLGVAAASGAQAFLTSDLRHHPASERPAGLALLDAAHWATEWPWLDVAASRLAAATGLECAVSRVVTDPFCLSSRSPRA
jgi:dinuclear metal center YbgI/SA1388 family protein